MISATKASSVHLADEKYFTNFDHLESNIDRVRSIIHLSNFASISQAIKEKEVHKAERDQLEEKVHVLLPECKVFKGYRELRV